MILEQFVFAFLTIFPCSFLAYQFSERSLVTHQSRVGLAQLMTQFILQALLNTKDSLFRPTLKIDLFILSVHLLMLFLVPFVPMLPEEFKMQGGLYVLICSFCFVLVAKDVWQIQRASGRVQAQNRIDLDRKITLMIAGGVLAILSTTSLFALENNWSVYDLVQQQSPSFISWGIFKDPFQVIFFIIFQISGMVMFEEHPFDSETIKNVHEYSLASSKWLSSSRFYVWSVMGASLFLGSGWLWGEWIPILSFLIIQIKAMLIYVLFRLIALYWPRYNQKEMLRATLVYLAPFVMFLLLASWIFRGFLMVSSGELNA
jgi:hypothetical protein